MINVLYNIIKFINEIRNEYVDGQEVITRQKRIRVNCSSLTCNFDAYFSLSKVNIYRKRGPESPITSKLKAEAQQFKQRRSKADPRGSNGINENNKYQKLIHTKQKQADNQKPQSKTTTKMWTQQRENRIINKPLKKLAGNETSGQGQSL